MTRGYLFPIFLVFQSQRAPWVEAHTCHPSPHQTAEAGEFRVGSHPGLHCEAIFQANKTPECSEPRPPRFAALSQGLLVYQVSALSWACHGQPGLYTDYEFSSPAPPMRWRRFVLLLFSLIINTDLHMCIYSYKRNIKCEKQRKNYHFFPPSSNHYCNFLNVF